MNKEITLFLTCITFPCPHFSTRGIFDVVMVPLAVPMSRSWLLYCFFLLVFKLKFSWKRGNNMTVCELFEAPHAVRFINMCFEQK